MDGTISNAAPPPSYIKREIPNIDYSFIAILSVDMDTTSSGEVSYRESKEPQTLVWASEQISRFVWRRFLATQTIIVTYFKVPVKGSANLMTFQGVLATDGNDTFLISYYRLHFGIHWQGIMGYSNMHCDWNWFRGPGDSMKTTHLYTNTGFTGQYIYQVNTRRCMDEGLRFF